MCISTLLGSIPENVETKFFKAETGFLAAFLDEKRSSDFFSGQFRPAPKVNSWLRSCWVANVLRRSSAINVLYNVAQSFYFIALH
jgi:hypothetical protein